LTDGTFYVVGKVGTSVKATMMERYCKKCRLLIYQESAEISGILLIPLMHSFCIDSSILGLTPKISAASGAVFFLEKLFYNLLRTLEA
jgi:hypothetical protein